MSEYGSLKSREIEILRLMSDDLTNREIGERLYIGLETVRWYAKQIYSKLHVSGRDEAVEKARLLHLLEATPPSEQAKTTLKHNLQPQLTSFIGREKQIAAILQLLSESRLLTLTGPGGTGKTRLCLKVAEQLVDDFADGVFFVDLAPVGDSALVPYIVAATLKINERAEESIVKTLQHALHNQQMLLLLDNYEHVINAAPFTLELLAACDKIKILVTSREPLRVTGEHIYHVPPMTMPEVDVTTKQHLLEHEAIALFVQQAQAVKSNFELSPDNSADVTEICRRLDGMPLAIELAAARSGLMTTRIIAQRLDQRLHILTGGARDLPSRQQTLRNTIDWSYHLLDESEQALFQRLSVFRGGRSLEAIEAVCGAKPITDVFDTLASLIAKNMIRQVESPLGEPRFVMLETLQEYAGEKLAASGEFDTIQEAHAWYFVQFVEQISPDFYTTRLLQILNRIKIEQENIRLALQWADGNNRVEWGHRIFLALHSYLMTVGYMNDTEQWINVANKNAEAVSGLLYGRVLHTIGALKRWVLCDIQSAILYLEKALAIYRQHEIPLSIATALYHLSLCYYDQPEKFDYGIALAEESNFIYESHQSAHNNPGFATLIIIGYER
jgi:predicted ATPase/DNA-binding CsgD family transcriptional regulator